MTARVCIRIFFICYPPERENVVREGCVACWCDLIEQDKARGVSGTLCDRAISLTQGRTLVTVHTDYRPVACPSRCRRTRTLNSAKSSAIGDVAKAVLSCAFIRGLRNSRPNWTRCTDARRQDRDGNPGHFQTSHIAMASTFSVLP